MLTYHFRDDTPTPGLAGLIERQRQAGGRLVLYRRAWAALVVIASQDRVVWVAPGESRQLAGWRQSLFTCVAGLWSFASVIVVPTILFANFRGGIDVTEFYSTAPIDPLRATAPVAGTAAKEEKNAQWALLGFLLVALAVILVLVLN